MDKLGKDVLVMIALDYDLPTILSFCSSSKRFNNVICKNNNFWISKLRKDFDIDYLQSTFYKNLPEDPILRKKSIELGVPARHYYKHLMSLLDQYNYLIEFGIDVNDLDIVKVGVKLGKIRNSTMDYAFKYATPEIFEYLLNHGGINSENSAMSIILVYLEKIKSVPKKEKISLIIELYDKILPKTYQYLDKMYFVIALRKLEEFKNQEPDNLEIQELYKRHNQELRKLIQQSD